MRHFPLGSLGFVAISLAGVLAPGLIQIAQAQPSPVETGDGVSANAASQFPPQPDFSPGQPISRGHVVLVLSNSRKTVYGYSTHTGDWAKEKTDLPEGAPFPPLFGPEIAFFRDRSKAHAFSALTGKWASVEITGPVQPMLDAQKLSFHVDSKIYMFSGESGKWSMVDAAED